MPKHRPNSVRDAYNNSYQGANKYYKTLKRSRYDCTYHADKHCHYLNDKPVTRIKSHDIASHADTCDHCTSESTELENIVEKSKYR